MFCPKQFDVVSSVDAVIRSLISVFEVHYSYLQIMASSGKFRKLNVDLPHQKVKNQMPWLLVGILFALIILLSTVYLYFKHRNREPVLQQQQLQHKN